MTSEEIHDLALRQHQMKDEEAVEFVMSNPKGRWFINRLLERCHITEPSYAESDTNRLLIHEGERRVGIDILVNIDRLDNGLKLRQMMEQEKASFYRYIKEIEDKEE